MVGLIKARRPSFRYLQGESDSDESGDDELIMVPELPPSYPLPLTSLGDRRRQRTPWQRRCTNAQGRRRARRRHKADE